MHINDFLWARAMKRQTRVLSQLQTVKKRKEKKNISIVNVLCTVYSREVVGGYKKK
jgi:hypothetical protein